MLSTQEINAGIDDSFDELVAWLEARSEEDLNEIKHEGKWTAAGHVFHLVKSTKAVSKAYKFPKLVLRMKFGKNNRKERTYDELVARYKVALTPVANQPQLQAPDEFIPEKGRSFGKEEIIKRFRDEQKDFKAAFSKWNDKDMSEYILPHPAVGKLTIKEMASFTILHTRHHLAILRKKY